MLNIIDYGYYSLLIFISLYIYVVVRNLYQLSSHKPLDFFSKAFLSISIAFILQFFMNFIDISYLSIGFSFFLSLFGLYLSLSLVSKHLDDLLSKELLILLISGLLSVMDYYYAYFVLIVQIGILLISAIITYSNYKETRNKMTQLFFISIVIALVSYLLNFLLLIISPFFPDFLLYVYFTNLSAAFLFLYEVVICQRKGKG
jgi:hypothetical protein